MKRATGAALGALAFLGCTVRGVEVHEAYAFAPATPEAAAVYFTVVNRGSRADTLVAARVDGAAGAMLHRTVEEGGTAHMEHVVALPLAPGDSAALAPGRMHLMLTGLARLPQAGDTLSLTLRFARAGERAVRVPVRAYGDAP